MERTTDVIAIDKNAYFYLNRIQRSQRGCKPLTQEQEDKYWLKLRRKGNDNLVEVDDNSFGGGDGTYYGKWWSWSVKTLRKMLSDGGYTWEERGTIQYICL